MRFTLLTTISLSVLMLQCQSQSTPVDESNEITYYKNEVEVDRYFFRYRTGDGTTRTESGSFENGVWTVRGMVAYRLPEGYVLLHVYQADANGYKVDISRVGNFPPIYEESPPLFPYEPPRPPPFSSGPPRPPLVSYVPTRPPPPFYVPTRPPPPFYAPTRPPPPPFSSGFSPVTCSGIGCDTKKCALIGGANNCKQS